MILVVHPLHFSTYQGVPEADKPAPAFACPDDVGAARAPELPPRFDSEGPGMLVPVRLPTGSIAATGTVHEIKPDSAFHGHTAESPTVTSSEAPRRFDSEAPPAVAEGGLPAASTALVRQDATAYPATVQLTASIPTPRVTTVEATRRFDSEGPQRDGEHRDGNGGSSGGGGRTVSGSANFGIEFVVDARGSSSPAKGRFDSETPQSTGERTERATQTIGGQDIRQVSGAAYVGSAGHGRPERARFDSESPQRDGEHREGAASSAAGGGGGGGGGQTVEIGQAVEFDTAMPVTVRKAAQVGEVVEKDTAMPITVHGGEQPKPDES